MVAELLEFPTGKRLILFPTFQMLAGDYDYPFWFAREGKEQLKANEPYALCAGIGFVLRYWPLVTKFVNPEVDTARFNAHVMEYPRKFPKAYVESVIEGYAFQLSEILDGLEVLMVPRLRRHGGHHAQLRNVKRMRDDLESVKQMLALLGQPVSTETIDAKAHDILPFLADDHQQLTIIEPRLNTLYDNLPHLWWAVKGTL